MPARRSDCVARQTLTDTCDLFTEALAFVDLNITRVVQQSQLPGVMGYHRRVFASWAGEKESYLVWDSVEAPAGLCAQATFNLHVVTELRWSATVGCSAGAGGDYAGKGCTRVHCNALENQTMDVVVLRPANALPSSPVRRIVELPGGAATLEVGSTLYLLGSRTNAPDSMHGLAAVVGVERAA
jgi:hypothetical protein